MTHEYLKWHENEHTTLYIQKSITGYDAPKYKMIIANDETGEIKLRDMYINWYPNIHRLVISFPFKFDPKVMSSPEMYLSIETVNDYDVLKRSTEKEFMTALVMI